MHRTVCIRVKGTPLWIRDRFCWRNKEKQSFLLYVEVRAQNNKHLGEHLGRYERIGACYDQHVTKYGIKCLF